ncbi:MAG TPA: hypothetical protein VEN81_17095, partial [Planctomycetota bacterium]|nr:hypothetical protein [Planctomycetota bacterium]
MTFLLWGILCLQDAPLAAERARLASRPALTETDKESYRFPALARPGKIRTSYTLAVIPVEFADQGMGRTDLAKLFFELVSAYFSRVSGGRF